MGLFGQMKAAQDMLKNMSPEQIQELMAQAKQAQSTMAEQTRATLEEEIRKRNLVSHDEVVKMLEEHERRHHHN
ncbi:MAG: hypothetical protein HYZ09_01965 [Candidatus Kerfeldbacteria bacterium]|nr:hypothetical protein [Candidatus Kerfeldbacteria bacterium]